MPEARSERVVVDELQKTATEISSLTARLEEVRRRQRALVVEAINEHGLRLSLVATLIGVTPQRVHAIRAEELERRERVEAAERRLGEMPQMSEEELRGMIESLREKYGGEKFSLQWPLEDATAEEETAASPPPRRRRKRTT